VADTSNLIDELVADCHPIKRLRPPTIRAFLWLLGVGAVAALGIGMFADVPTFLARAADPALAVELAATLATGVLAVLAALQLSLPDRSPAWALVPVPSLAIWLGSSSYGCYRSWLSTGPVGWELGQSADCFLFIVGFSVPVAASLVLVLRRSAPLAPARVAGVGALGVAALVAVVLQFFHPFDVTFLDLGLHLSAIALIVVGVSAVEQLSTRFRLSRA
jgi:hypothetical protein